MSDIFQILTQIFMCDFASASAGNSVKEY